MVRNSKASRDGWFWAELWTSTDPQRDLYRLLSWAKDEGITLPDLEVRRPSLEDVFLEVTSSPEENGR